MGVAYRTYFTSFFRKIELYESTKSVVIIDCIRLTCIELNYTTGIYSSQYILIVNISIKNLI